MGLAGRLATGDDGLRWSWRDDDQPRLVVPAQERSVVMARAHDDAVGHLFYEVRRRFWWPGLRRDVRAYV